MVAKLTSLQLANKALIWGTFTSRETRDLPAGQRKWREGYRIVLVGDECVVYADGHQGFKIGFEHSREHTAELIK